MKFAIISTVFLISTVFSDTAKEKAADNAKNDSQNILCFKCNFLSGGDDAKNCQNPVQGSTQTVACPKTGYCITRNKITTLVNNAGTKQELIRTCYTEADKPSLPAFKNITFVQGQSQCADSTTSSNQQNSQQLATSQSCVEICQGNLCNTSTPTQSSGLSTGAIIGIVIGCVVGLTLIVGLVVYFMKYKGRSQVPTNDPATEMN